jgi:hypothetical protein
MLSDFLLGVAWVAIVMIPVIVAYRQPIVSHNGYVNSYMDPGGTDAEANEPSADANPES